MKLIVPLFVALLGFASSSSFVFAGAGAEGVVRPLKQILRGEILVQSGEAITAIDGQPVSSAASALEEYDAVETVEE